MKSTPASAPRNHRSGKPRDQYRSDEDSGYRSNQKQSRNRRINVADLPVAEQRRHEDDDCESHVRANESPQCKRWRNEEQERKGQRAGADRRNANGETDEEPNGNHLQRRKLAIRYLDTYRPQARD